MISYVGPYSSNNVGNFMPLGFDYVLVIRIANEETPHHVWWHCFVAFQTKEAGLEWLEGFIERGDDERLEARVRLGWRPIALGGYETPGGYITAEFLETVLSEGQGDEHES